MPQGTFSDPSWIVGFISQYFSAVTAANTVMLSFVAPYNGKIGGIMVNGATAGVGAGNTVIDIQKNGVSIWSVHAGNRPTLASASTGLFTSQQPEVTTFATGDVLNVIMATIPATSSHSGITITVTLEKPHGGAYFT